MTHFINYVFSLFIVSMCLYSLEGQLTTKDIATNSTNSKTMTLTDKKFSEVRKYWLNSDRSLKVAMGRLIKMAMPIVMREVYSRNISTDCLNSLLLFSSALRKTKLWAFEMLDASGKLPEGFLAGTLTILGDYQECVNIKVNESRKIFQGQYCTIGVTAPLPERTPFMSIHLPPAELLNVSASNSVVTYLLGVLHNLHVLQVKLGLCVPSLCDEHDVQKLVQIIPERTGLDWKFDVNRCEIKQILSFTYTQTIILCVFGVMAFLIVCGSIADFIYGTDNPSFSNAKGTALQWILSFSLFSNVRKLAAYTSPHENTRFVHGIMFICIFWILISNTFMYVNYHIASNFMEALRITKVMFFEIVLNRTIPIQTFFFVSGFVAAYKWLKSPEENVSLWKYILKRFWRYTPTYLLMIGFVMLTPTWGSGPSWLDHMTPIYDKCRVNWWANVFYINNFLDMETSCMDHTWIFAVDAQLYVLALAVLIPLKRRPAIGLMLNAVLIGASVLTVALTNVYYDVPPSEMLAFLHTKDRAFFASHTYFRIYTHICMYCSGIMAGYVVAEKPKFKLSKTMTVIVWLILGAAALSIACGLHEWKDGVMPSPFVGAMYAAFGKAGWAAFLAWTAIYCGNGHGGGLNDFLGWRPFSFFARLAFTGYIIHPILIQVVMAFKKSHLHVEKFELIYSVTSEFLCTFVLAYLCFMAFEAPFLSLTEVVRRKTRSSCFGSDPNDPSNSNAACNGVMTEKPMKYEDKRKQDEKLREVNVFRTKC